MKETHLRQERQTVKVGLIKVVQDLFPGEHLKTAYSINEGVFCKLTGSALSTREVRQISVKLQEWVEQNNPIEFVKKDNGYYQYKIGESFVNVLYPANTYSSMVEPFKIIPYGAGFIVDFGDSAQNGTATIIPPDKLSLTYDKTQRWLKNINIELVADVNAYVDDGKGLEIVCMAEALQEK
ncbi:MAG: hypothetical protein ACRCZU_00390, partial [Selenomonadaceae bacterium]